MMYGVSPAERPQLQQSFPAGPGPFMAGFLLVVLALSLFIIAGAVIVSVARTVRVALRYSGLPGAIERCIAPVRHSVARHVLLPAKICYQTEIRPRLRDAMRRARRRSGA